MKENIITRIILLPILLVMALFWWIITLFKGTKQLGKLMIETGEGLVKDDTPPPGHWSDNWDKAEYRIMVISNINGNFYYAQRKGYGQTKWEGLNSLALATEQDARIRIEDDKKFYTNSWYVERQTKTEYIPA